MYDVLSELEELELNTKVIEFIDELFVKQAESTEYLSNIRFHPNIFGVKIIDGEYDWNDCMIYILNNKQRQDILKFFPKKDTEIEEFDDLKKILSEDVRENELLVVYLN